ncbi:MAG: hypothetical protein IKG97_03190, partial [Lachnospiraceae bacterium]|nr:hypothetical protein [Lachnospiraceae bacterium]
MSKAKTADLPPRKAFSWKRLRNQFLNLVGNPFNMVVFFSLIILIALIVIPLLTMVSNTLFAQKQDLQYLNMQKMGIVNPIEFKKLDPKDYLVHDGDMTLWYWQQVLAGQLSKEILWEPLLHSLTIGFFVTIISIPLGAVMAWIMVRT